MLVLSGRLHKKTRFRVVKAAVEVVLIKPGLVRLGKRRCLA
jgi:hypothetical protein